ncbi:MAG: UDP-N-acetylmuramate--L-alanine ligase [Bacteroidales bacterium]|nr:UDP-N-acetylmuramate--L-alanine ligase [Bacteroidales bacterium]
MDFEKIHRVYFLGIGGIGMSALARYFKANGKAVAGYDKTSTALTDSLAEQGIDVHFTDSVDSIPSQYLSKTGTLIVLTPAVPDDHKEYLYFKNKGFDILKRAQVLGLIFNAFKGVAVAGTHGKTSTTTFTSYLLKECGIDCSAFLGGISKNYGTNLLLGKSDVVVAEADEFDRSFLQLHPFVSLVTTVDADHLDIYRNISEINDAFQGFLSQTATGGTVILKKGVDLKVPPNCNTFSYSLDNAESDFYASDIRIADEKYVFSFNTPSGVVPDMLLSIPGKTNIENAVAAMSVCYVLGISPERLKDALPGLKGVVRRFDIQYQDDKCVYIDDYAHHPRELDAIIGSLRDLYKGRKITGIFQPHLYSRTRDFAQEFAKSLSALDELVLLDIYPAREKPIPGVSSDMLFNMVSVQQKHLCSKINLLNTLKGLNIEVLLTAGAGDIDQIVGPVKQFLTEREKG